MSMEWGGAEASDLKAAGAEPLPRGRNGLVLKGWCIESRKRSILSSLALREWEETLGTSHMPEMVFGESSLSLLHISSGIKLHFNALDALRGWKQESLPPIEVPAAAKWKYRSKPSEQVILDYDYTFTKPYCGSEMIEPNYEKKGLHWRDTDERIDLAALSSREPILFYDEVVLYKDELADNGVSLLTVKVRVMPSCWFLLLRYWLRVDGVLMRLRDSTRKLSEGSNHPKFVCSYGDPNLIVHKLPIIMQKNQGLKISS